MPKSFFLDDAVHGYVLSHSTPLDPVAQALIDETAALGPVAGMQIAPDQGQLLTLLTATVGAVNAVEVGTFTGFSALCIARGLRPGGRLLCCDVSTEWTSIGQRHWAAAGVDDVIDLRIAPALDTLRALPNDPVVDLAFVDADKGNYVNYYEQLVPRLRPGGLILTDNVLWHGAVLDTSRDDDDTNAIRAFNDHVVRDPRVDAVLLTIGDGMTIARRRE